MNISFISKPHSDCLIKCIDDYREEWPTSWDGEDHDARTICLLSVIKAALLSQSSLAHTLIKLGRPQDEEDSVSVFCHKHAVAIVNRQLARSRHEENIFL